MGPSTYNSLNPYTAWRVVSQYKWVPEDGRDADAWE